MAAINKQPVPVSITIRNFFPSLLPLKASADTIQDDRSKTSCYVNRNECINIPSCQLEIIEKDTLCAKKGRTICSMHAAGSHPHWDHLNEQIDPDSGSGFVYARITVGDRTTELPLQPSHLKPAAKSDSLTVPESLPANAVLVFYDDGWTRVIPSLYSLLVERNVIGEVIDDDNDPKEVFSDSAFDVLDAADDAEISDDKQENSKESVYNDKVFDLLGSESSSQNKSSQTALKDQDADTSNANQSTLESKVNPEMNHVEVDTTQIPAEAAAAADSQNKLPAPPPLTKETSESLRMQREIAELRRKVQQEKDLLKQEEKVINRDAERLKSVIEKVHKLKKETYELQNQASIDRGTLFRASFRLEAHRAHLLKRLRIIFPIKLVRLTAEGHSVTANQASSQHQLTIAGIPLPDDIHHPATSDDQVSTALGFTCHLMVLISKYLDIPMRYRIVCKFSRSVIIDEDRGGMKVSVLAYPLFRERGVVDREQLDHGLILLTRNTDTLLRRSQIEYRDGWNVLAKLDRLLSSLVEGKEEL